MSQIKIFFFTLLFPSLLLGAESSSQPLSFKDCFELAIKQSERLMQSQENIEQAKSRRKEALGSVLPSLHWTSLTTIQDTSGVNNNGNENNSNSLREKRTESKFVVRQPLFQGFKEFSAVSSYKAEQRRNEALLMQETVNLYLTVAQAFFRVLQLEQFQMDTRTLISLTDDRIKELKGRIRLGKSRESESLTVESQLASHRSQEAATEGDIVSARDVLGFLIGVDVRNVPLVDSVLTPVAVDPEEQMLKFGVNRSDVRALKEDAEAKRYAVRVAKADYYPAAAVVGEYFTHRRGIQSEVDWDILFSLDVPIFQGGVVKAFAEEAQSRYRQADLELQRGMRFAESEIRQAHAMLTSSLREEVLLKTAYEKAKRSYDSLVKEYRLGLVNNLDVLAAMNNMQQVKINYDTAMLQAKLDTLKLKAVTEELP